MEQYKQEFIQCLAGGVLGDRKVLELLELCGFSDLVGGFEIAVIYRKLV